MPTINGTPGNDFLSTSTSGNFIDAGAGNDKVTIVPGSNADGGPGDDLLVMDAHSSADNLQFEYHDGTTQNFERFELSTGSGNDLAYFYPGTTSSIWGGDFWDAGGGTDKLMLGLAGFTGNITAGYINSTSFKVTQDGPGPSVLLTVYNVEDVNITASYNGPHGTTNTLSGGAGNDTLFSYSDQSILSGGAGNDDFYCYSGTVDGGSGFDRFSLGYNADFYAIAPLLTFNNDGTITLTDYSRTVVLKNIESLQSFDQAWLGTSGNDAVNLPVYYEGRMYFAGPGDDTITIGDGIHHIDGGAGNDTVIFSGPISNYAFDRNSNGDITIGGSAMVNVETVQFTGAVAKFGTNGSDILSGTAGNDLLFGSGGDDTLNGGGGNDTAAFSGTYNDSHITFNPDGSLTVTGPDGTDTLTNFENVKFSDEIAVLGTTGNDSVTLNGFFDGRNGVGFAGGSGNDTVTSNGGEIFFDGGDGTDTIILPVNYQGYTPYTPYPQTYVTQIGGARLLNVEIVKFDNGTATLSNGQLTFTAAQPSLNNNGTTVQVPYVGYATTLAPGMVLSNPGGSSITGAVIKIASGFVSGDILTVSVAGTNISASYNGATGVLTLSGTDTAAHYEQALRSVQMVANATWDNHPFQGTVTWQVTNSDPSSNVSALISTQLSLPPPGASFNQLNEAIYISGVDPGGKIVSQSFQTWLGDAPAHYDSQDSFAAKWGNNIAGTSGGTVSYYFDTASNWGAAEQSMFSSGLALWSALANINFTLTSNPSGAEITFVRGNDGGATTGPSTAPTGGPNAGKVNSSNLWQLTGVEVSIDTGVPGFGPIGNFTAFGGYPLNTIVHEEGHALGLGHAGPYDGSAVSPFTNQLGEFDSRLYSLMSYIDPEETHAHYYPSYNPPGTDWGTTTENGAPYRNVPTTPMALDIAAAQLLYGAPVNSPLSGGQVFGFNTNITGDIRAFFDFTQNINPIVTLFDMGTNNALDLSGFSSSSTVNLNPGAFSSCDGMTNNISIAFNTRIDKFVGGSGDDAVTGNNNGNVLLGGLGNDTFTGGFGNDTLNGGKGSDTAIFSQARSNYTIAKSGATTTVSGPNGIDTLTGIEHLQFSDQLVTVATNEATVFRANLNGDAHSDILWQHDSGQAGVWLMDGTTILSNPYIGTSAGPAWHVIGAGDFDGNGKADMLWQATNGQAGIWFMDGAAVLDNPAVGSNPGSSWHVIASADLDGNGKSDIIWQHTNGQAGIWLMDGQTMLSNPKIGITPNPAWHVVAAGDMDGSGTADLIWRSDFGQIGIWFMDGETILDAPVLNTTLDTSWKMTGTGDFDGDREADLLWQNTSGQVAIWLMQGINVMSKTNIANPGADWLCKGTADLNGDGKADILWQNANGQAAAWMMNGTSILSQGNLGSNPGTSWHVVASTSG